MDEGGAYGGVPATIPGTIQAEFFDEGGPSMAYPDSTEGTNRGYVGGISSFTLLHKALELCLVRGRDDSETTRNCLRVESKLRRLHQGCNAGGSF